MARRHKRGRPVNGILLLDKPEGITSNKALQSVKNMYFAQKAGHTGSLDPLATGMLPICFGDATKVSAFLLDADKRYQLSCKLGVVTNTGDSEGEIISQADVPELNREQLEAVLNSFKGEIEQIPPMFSALKHKGERLYNLARQGIEVERKARAVTIYELDLINFEGDTLKLDVSCSKGTYVRTLVEDIGAKLGCGAHVTQLRRLTVGPFTDPEKMVTVEQLEALREHDRDALDDLLLPTDAGLMHWPDVQLNADMSYYLLQGQPVQVPRAPTEGWVRIYNADKQQFIGVGQVADDGKIAPKRLFQVNQ